MGAVTDLAPYRRAPRPGWWRTLWCGMSLPWRVAFAAMAVLLVAGLGYVAWAWVEAGNEEATRWATLGAVLVTFAWCLGASFALTNLGLYVWGRTDRRVRVVHVVVLPALGVLVLVGYLLGF